jgi:endonuclease G
MDKNKKLLLLLFLAAFVIGFILFLIYRPDQAEARAEAKRIHSYPYRGIEDFYSEPQGDQLVKYTSISLAYDEKHEQPLWVCYLLTKQQLEHPVCKRNNRFKADPNIVSGSASLSDYYKSGYDRGHLAPAADMLWSKQAMKESFYMSNMSPQLPAFNRGAWKRLESAVRKTARLEDSLIIITGPLFNDTLGSIGQNHVSIPAEYYKVVVDISAPHLGAVAFIMPHRNTKLPLNKFVVSVDSLEHYSGIDFMAPLPDPLENQLEGTIDKALLEKLMY